MTNPDKLILFRFTICDIKNPFENSVVFHLALKVGIILANNIF
jgi:hypothetical protein